MSDIIRKMFLQMKPVALFMFSGFAPMLLSFALYIQLGLSRPVGSFTSMTAFLLIISTIVFYMWLWIAGAHFYSRHKSANSNIRTVFNLSIVLTFASSLFFLIAIMVGIQSNIGDFLMSLLILLLGMTSGIGFLTVIFIFSKWFSIVVYGDKHAKEQFVKTVILLCFFPIGLWLIQPRVVDSFAQESEDERDGTRLLD